MWNAKRYVPLLAGVWMGCSSDASSNVGAFTDPLRHADEDVTTRAVVLVSSGCTGTLVAPNLVLTAKHCVVMDDESAPIVDGCRGVFRGLLPSPLFVTPASPVRSTPSERFAVKETRFSPVEKGRADVICGHDRAFLILEKVIPSTDITPLGIRLDCPPARFESVSVVGYGASGDENVEDLFKVFTRRRIRDGRILCVGVGCHTSVQSTANEMTVQAEVCKGDSGGPLLDRHDQVIGLLSRGVHEVCGTAEIFEDMYSARAWVSQVAVEAAAIGAYPVPDWVVPLGLSADSQSVPNPYAQDPECANRSLRVGGGAGCSASVVPPPSRAPVLLLASFFCGLLTLRLLAATKVE